VANETILMLYSKKTIVRTSLKSKEIAQSEERVSTRLHLVRLWVRILTPELFKALRRRGPEVILGKFVSKEVRIFVHGAKKQQSLCAAALHKPKCL